MRGLWFPVLASALALGSTAAAHTTVRSPMTEGVRDDNAFRIGHGCGERGAVIAQSVVFPTDAPLVTTSDPNVVVADLSEMIAPAGLANLAQSIQDRSIFLHQAETLDADGNVVGFQARWGRLEPELLGRVPFQFSPPSFVAESCAKRLLIRIAIADICNVRRPLLDPEKLSLWAPDNGSQIVSKAIAAGVEVGTPATLTVNRNLATNPLPETCGAGVDVIVTPSPAQIDRDLPIGWYWNPR